MWVKGKKYTHSARRPWLLVNVGAETNTTVAQHQLHFTLLPISYFELAGAQGKITPLDRS